MATVGKVKQSRHSFPYIKNRTVIGTMMLGDFLGVRCLAS